MSSHQPLSFMKEAHKIAFDNCVPWFVSIEITLSCNLSCKHCYNFDRSKVIPESLKSSMPTDMILNLITDLKKAGTLMISFTGGEALLHPHFFDFVKKARSENLLVKLKSNGTLITNVMATKIKNSEIMSVDISLYGCNSSEHDHLTTIPGSFDETISGIKNLTEQNIPVEINYSLYKNNVKSIEKMIELAQELNCKFNFNAELTEKYDQSKFESKLRLDLDDYCFLLASSAKDYFLAENESRSLQCECARTVCAINAKGDVLPCIGAPIVSGSILNDTFENVWKNSNEFIKIRNLKKEDFKECIDCEMITKCYRSSGSAFANTGNYTGKNPWNCTEAKARIKSGF